MKIYMMRVEFDCGEVLYYEPHTFMLLPTEFINVKNWERVTLDTMENIL